MTRTRPILRQPYRRRTNAEWDEIRRLYQAGATAKALVGEYGGTERTLYTRARRDGWLRKDDPVVAATDPGLTPREADRAVRQLGADEGVPEPDQACRDLPEDASLDDAARAAAAASIAMLRDGHTARAYAYARMAGTLERLARGAVGDADAAGARRTAALDFLRSEVLREFGPDAGAWTDG